MKIKQFFIAALFLPLSALAGEFTALAGVAQFQNPHDGIYWNKNRPHDNFMTPAVYGVRYDSNKFWGGYSLGVQYTNFGVVKIDALAVSADAPAVGGYDSSTGTCVGTCAQLGRWKMQTETQSIAFVGTKHAGRWGFDVGLNIYETKTRGNVKYEDGGRFNYKETTWLDVGPMAGIAYHHGPWSARLQLWRMEGRSRGGDGYSAPAAFNENVQATLMVGYTF